MSLCESIKDESSYSEKLCVLFWKSSGTLFCSIATDETEEDVPHTTLRNYDDFVLLDDEFSSFSSFDVAESLISFTTKTWISSQCLANNIWHGRDNPKSVKR